MSSNPIKTLANQLNCLRSTGPRTATGKAMARANSLKHGLLSRNLIIPGENATLGGHRRREERGFRISRRLIPA